MAWRWRGGGADVAWRWRGGGAELAGYAPLGPQGPKLGGAEQNPAFRSKVRIL